MSHGACARDPLASVAGQCISLPRRTLAESGITNGAADPKLAPPPPPARAPAAAAEPAGDESEAEELARLAAQHARLGPLRTPQVCLSRQFTSAHIRFYIYGYTYTAAPKLPNLAAGTLTFGHNAPYL